MKNGYRKTKPAISVEKILILGGTREAALLAGELIAAGHDVSTSLAGRTRDPEPLPGKLRIGGFGGPEKLAAFLVREGFTRMIDATHPFAEKISANAVEAARIANVPLDIRLRKPWRKIPGDHWIEVNSLEEARDVLPTGARALLALGSQHINIFASRDDVHFVVRMVDRPDEPLSLPRHDLIAMKPGDVASEKALFSSRRLTHIVCRNSGGKGAQAKLAAARELGLPVVMIQRTPLEQGM
ncbi:MAG: cobalt-precorrin-6A reductase [Nitratireductor sp.]